MVGILILNIELKLSFDIFISFFEILKFLGKKKNKIKIDDNSLITLDRIKNAIAYLIPLVTNIGRASIIINNLTMSSVILETTCGSIFCFPKKYPLKMLDIDINGSVKPIDIIPYLTSLLCSKLLLIKSLPIIRMNISINVTPKAIGSDEKTRFLLFLVSSATNLLIATGKPNCDIEISKLNVGIISMYVPIPIVPKFLVIVILITIPSNLVITPPRSNIIVDLMNLFFTLSPNYIYVKFKVFIKELKFNFISSIIFIRVNKYIGDSMKKLNNKGFGLVEALVIVAILTFVIDISYPYLEKKFNLNQTDRSAEEAKCILNAQAYIRSLDNKLMFDGVTNGSYYVTELAIPLDDNTPNQYSWVVIEGNKVIKASMLLKASNDQILITYSDGLYDASDGILVTKPE